MTDERKNALGETFLRPAVLNTAALARLDTAELRFLIRAAEHFIGAKALPESGLPDKLPAFHAALLDKLNAAPALFIAYDEATDTPFLDPDGRMWLFSNADNALAAQEHYAQTVPLLIRKVLREEMAEAFVELYTLGISDILLDNGLDSVEISRDDIIPPPDWTDTPAASVPVTNPKLMFAMLRFFQVVRSKAPAADLSVLEEAMLREVLAAKYLVPMRVISAKPAPSGGHGAVTLEKGSQMEFAQIRDAEKNPFQPAFTDWAEFRKAFDQKTWGGYVASYDDLLTLSRSLSGIVVNCGGTPLRLDEHARQRIETFRRVK